MEQPRVYFRCHSRSSWAIGKAIFLGAVNKPVQYLKKQIFQSQHPPKVGINLKAIQTNTWKRELLPGEAIGDKRTDRIQPDTCLLEANAVAQIVVSILDEAINNHQSDHIADARNCLQNVFERLSKADARSFEFPTGYGRKVLERGIELFLKDGVSCSLKHGILLLDSSNSGAQFYVGLLNLVGAFAVTISEYQISEKMFSLLISWHRKTNVTTHLRDLGAAFNNAGCISLIKGDLKQAESNFDASLKNLKSAEKLQWPHGINSSAHKVQRSRNSSLDVMLIAVESNVSRLFLMSRDFGSALAKQELIVESCKAQNSALPIEEVFTVVNNQAVLHTTLTNFEKAEEALEWLKCYCIEMKREECNFLLNFVSLHLCEVLLLSGKSKEAEKVLSLETLTSAHGTKVALMFGGLHINVRTEAIEKIVDVLVLRGKVKFACDLLEKGVNILKKSFGPDHYNVASMLYKQGMILSLLGEFSDSIDKLECSVAILEEMFGTKHPFLLKVYMSLGDVALTLKRKDESFLYFQRAMENIEELYQVSFVSQLSTRYVKMTKNAKHFQEKRMHVNKTEGLVMDLVSEYGLAFAVVLSRVVVQRSDRSAKGLRTTGERPFMTKGLSIQCSSTMAIISLKCTRDFLQSGQSFLRQGMTKEAAAFFQQAGEHCAAHQLLKGAPNQCLAHLYGILAKKRLESRKPLEDGNDLIACLKELSEMSTRATEDVIPLTSDCQLTLKLVLIFLIRLSIELKVIDVTFEAYDLYAKLFHSDSDFMFFYNGAVQFYASRTVIKCNGKTAVQDILVSSTIGLNEGDSDCCSSPDQQLFRSLACKNNVPTDSFLVTYNSSTLLDIDKLQELERKILLSVQECFQLRCFEAGVKSNATQVLVDLSSKSPSKPYDIVAVGRRIELLSLCLSEEISTEVSCGGQLFEISTAMRQTMTRLTFEDEQTSHFMFCKNALLLLQQCNPRNISTASVENHCLTLTITHPVKARLTLWHKNRCIAQKLQLVQTTRKHDPAYWMVPQQAFPEVPGGSYCVADGFLGPTIDHLAKKYRVACEIDISCIDVPLDDSDAYFEPNGIPLDEQQSQETRLNTFSQEYEENETLRMCLDGIRKVRDIQLESRVVQSDDSPSPIEVTFTSPTLKAEQGLETQSLSETCLQDEKPREADDKNEIGRSFVEKCKTSRSPSNDKFKDRDPSSCHSFNSSGATFEAPFQERFDDPYLSLKAMAWNGNSRGPWGRLNGTLEAPFQEGYEDHYFSTRAMAGNENLRAPWELLNQPRYASKGNSSGFWERHAVKSNGATLEAPFREGYEDHYFSTKAMACKENLQAPWEMFNQPGYPSEGDFLKLCTEGDDATRSSSRGDDQSPVSNQKPALLRDESWHFPPLETDKTTETHKKYFDGQRCRSRRNSTQSDSISSKQAANRRYADGPQTDGSRKVSMEDCMEGTADEALGLPYSVTIQTDARDPEDTLCQYQGSLQMDRAIPGNPGPGTDWNRSPAIQDTFKTRNEAARYSGGTSPAVTTSQTLALPNGVIKSIQSLACDAKAIVTQFQESLQLAPSTLANPDPETKRWIRCLAIQAKSENRTEVVKYLREITPAGTTGPLLDENLDVLDIPYRQRKDLTFHLSGGEEWKLLAETLGLSSIEIRFLDKRVVNPCDAVLGAIGRCRHFSVGELYDTLVDCELPIVADML